ncbi:MAG: glutathione S-transferase N-terminal domain-containing protein [Thermoleophilaceae bacterium]
MATLYRCKTPSDAFCVCGKVARRLRKSGIEFEEVRVPYMKRYRPEVAALTDQRWVPVLVHGEEVVHDSHRIVEYLDHLDAAAGPPKPAGSSARTSASGGRTGTRA